MKKNKKIMSDKKKKRINRLGKAFLKRSKELEMQERNFRFKALAGIKNS